MTYYGAKELADSFQTVRNNTIRIAEDIPEEKYSFKPSPESRTIAATLAHIALGYRFHYNVHQQNKRSTLRGFDFGAFMGEMGAEEAKPRTKAELIQFLKDEGAIWANWVRGVSEGILAETVEMPEGMTPAAKSRFEMIISVKEHEMHHRGQLMTMQRMLGIVPPLTRDMQARMAQAQAKTN